MSLNILSTLLGTIISSYLPFDYTLKSLCAQSISQLVLELKNIRNISLLQKLIPRNREVLIKRNNAIYEKLEEYIIEKYKKEFISCGLLTKRGNIDFELINNINRKIQWKDIFENHNVYIELKTVNNTANITNNNETSNETSILRIYSETATVEKLRDYVNYICDFKNIKTNVIKVYRSKIYKNSKNKSQEITEWEPFNIKTNKTIENTILSDEVQKELYEDIEWFINNEKWYNSKGIPYKRGYVLHGHPGTGKTSIVKAIANHYSLDIFLLDLETVESNTALYNLISEATYLANNKPHILSLEDADRCKLFNKLPHDIYMEGMENNKKLSMNTFLGIIDGIVETHGRILFLTVNDLKPLQNVNQNALLRPGRIDKIIKLDYCTKSQITKIIKHFYSLDSDEEKEIIEKMQTIQRNDITPADMIKILQLYPNKENLSTIFDMIQNKKSDVNEVLNNTNIQKKNIKSSNKRVEKQKRILNNLKRKKKSCQKFLETVDEKIKKKQEYISKQSKKRKKTNNNTSKPISKRRKKTVDAIQYVEIGK